MTDMDAAYYAENPDQFEALSEAEQDAIISGGILSGSDDTGESDEISEDDLDLVLEDDVDISAKDGKHKIPYDELKSARQLAHEEKSRADQLQALADQQAQLIADLQEAKNQDALTGGTDAQDAVIDDFREEFSDILGENFEKYLSQVIDEKVKPFREKAELAENELKKIKAASEAKAAEQEWDRVKSAHKDIDSLIESNAIGKWINSLPEFDQSGKWHVAQNGSVDEKIALIQMYKDANGIKAKSEVVEPSVKPAKVPTLLNDISGKSGEQSAAERYLTMDKNQQAAFLAGIDDPDAIERLVADIKKLQS